MSFFKNFFRKNTESSLTIEAPAATENKHRSIRHDPKLVDTLLEHHAKLGALYARIGKQAKAGNYKAIGSDLARLKTSLQGHILTENVRFYVYLEQSLADDAEQSRVMREFRTDMNGIAKEVVAFVNKWKDDSFSSSTARAQFMQDHKAMGDLLEQRFSQEEDNLYPMYGPS